MIVLLDAGHGGVVAGNYQTKGKRSPDLGCGVLYEGMFNRWVVNRLVELLDRAGIPYELISPEQHDIPLKERVRRVNVAYKRYKRQCYLISIHANAGGGEGIEVFTSKGQTKSDNIAELVMSGLRQNFAPTQKFRTDQSDGDQDKEVNFYILRRTKAPAILLECGFMDHEKDYLKLWDKDYLNDIVLSLFETIKKIYE